MDPLLEQRAALCDLLMGRGIRAAAQGMLERCLELEAAGLSDCALERLEQAAHWEWIACLVEQGRMLFGGRLNRCGYQPEVSE